MPLDYHQKPTTPAFDVVRLVSLQNGEVLLVKEVDDPNWKLPGGKIHAGETIFQALQREVREELGIPLSEEHILAYVSAPIPDSEHTRHIFRVKPINASSIIPTDEVHKAAYFSPAALPVTRFAEHISSAVQLIQKH